MKTMISIQFKNTIAEHIHAARVYDAHGFFGKGNKVVAALLVLAGAYLVYAVGVLWWTVIWFALAPVEWFDLLSIRPLQILLQFRFNLKYREEYHMEFDDSGLHFKTSTIDSHIAWSFYNRVIERDRIYLLIWGRMAYTVIPKRAFRSLEEIEVFRQLISQHIS
jgi:hypothetical protein